ncbi:Cof-type HAD-IIB family hydrolase [Cytobacillus sp. Hz8]|uniref:Cof-type HAD-IIB family hydrolase n=1 Tax=Cytobacillus sp. Hz8 TaxID=3347168 RepID=UPI0035DEA246
MYKLIAFDLDGTLLNEKKEISEQVCEAVRCAKTNGIFIVLSSGRSCQGMSQYIQQLGEDLVDYVIGFSGSLINEVKGNCNIYRLPLLKSDMDFIKQTGWQAGLSVHFVSEKEIYTFENPIGKYTVHESYLTNSPILYLADSQLPVHHYIYKVIFSGEKEDIDWAVRRIPEEFTKGFHFVRSGDNYLEIVNKNSGKGSALKFLAESLHIPQEEVVAFGDHENDLTMIEYAGLGIAMENAIDQVKEAANYVTKSNEKDGVAYALKTLVLVGSDGP